MQDQISNLGFNLAVGVITGVLVALVTTRLSLRRFYSERWWERKLQAYSTILESLYDMRRYSEEAVEAFESGCELSDDRRTELHVQYRRGRSEIDKASAIGAFVISGEASRYLAQLQRDLGAASHEESWYNHLDSEGAALQKCIEAIKECAKRDLRIQ